MSWQGKYLEAASIVPLHQDVVGQVSMSLQRMGSFSLCY